MMFPRLLSARQERLSGLLQYTYQQDRNKTPDSRSERNAFSQEYQLRYQGSVYHPRLLIYNIQGIFKKDDSETEDTQSGDSRFKSRLSTYNFGLDFLQGNRYPFSIYREQLEMPTSTETTKTKQVTDRYGIAGSALLGAGVNLRYDYAKTTTEMTTKTTTGMTKTKQVADRYGVAGDALLGAGVNLRYDYHQEDTKTTTETTTEGDRLYRNFLLGLNKRKEDKFADVSYSYQHVMEKQRRELDAINDIKTSFGLKPGKDTNFNMDASYHNSSLSEFTTTSSTMNFDYGPAAKFSANSNLYLNRLITKNERGDFATLYGNSTYKISQFFTTNQNLVLYRSSGDFGNERTESLGLNLIFNYAKVMPHGLTFSVDSSIAGNTYQVTTGKDRNIVSYSAGAGASKIFEEINTDLNLRGSYYYDFSSLGGKTARSAFNAGVSNRSIKNLTIQSILSYSEEEKTEDEVDSAPSVTGKTRTLTSDNSLTYFLRVGFRGSLDGKIGMNFTAGTYQRTFQYTDWTFRYALMRNLSLNAELRAQKESIGSDAILISNIIGVEYQYRALKISLRNSLFKEIYKTAYETDSGVETRKRSKTWGTTFLQVSRPF